MFPWTEAGTAGATGRPWCEARDSRIRSRMDCWAASLSSMEVILVPSGSESFLLIKGMVVADEEEEEEVGGSLDVADADAEDSLLFGRYRGTIAEREEVEREPDLRLEEADVRDLRGAVARLMFEIVRRGIGGDSFEGCCWRGVEFWFEEEEVRTGSTGGSNAELFPFWLIFRPRKSHEESAESRGGRTYRDGGQPANLIVG